ncbi:CPBP family glutamic-type intramembrane protease [Aquihabitans sp. McL0605]|uniref:CPBP family glutamic-type intramembrane protease n=1 Tax=Aquihabitans sp. McL0605 TaxID=3415671 RepID=UPI003CEEECCD
MTAPATDRSTRVDAVAMAEIIAVVAPLVVPRDEVDDEVAVPEAVPSTDPADTAAAQAPRFERLSTRRTLVLALAGITTLTELLSFTGRIPTIPMGGLELSASLIPALALGLACGSRLLGRSSVRRAAIVFWIVAAVMIPVLAYLFWRSGRLELVPTLIFAALDEELVYRLAIPAVIAAALRLGNVRPNAARIAGLVGAGIAFCLLPGHLEQMRGAAGFLPFAAFAGLSAFIVYRSGSVLPMAVGHAISNLLAVLVFRNAMPADARSLGLATVLCLLVLAWGRPARITVGDDGGLVDTQTGLAVTAIDLRDGQPALVELADGRYLPVHADMVRPRDVPVVDLPDDPAADEGRLHHELT